jgi:hypothetical protein
VRRQKWTPEYHSKNTKKLIKKTIEYSENTHQKRGRIGKKSKYDNEKKQGLRQQSTTKNRNRGTRKK